MGRVARQAGAVLWLALAALWWLPASSMAQGGSITIAAASDLQSVLPEIVSAFERETRATARVSFGSSGNFVTQIEHGAPFDVFLSADIGYPRRLVQDRLADGSTLYRYATGRLVLWTRNDSGLDMTKGVAAVVTDPRVARVAIANPQHAPYGRAAEAALRSLSLYDAVRGKLVMGENISQTAQFVRSGNADVGIIALSLATGAALRAGGRYIEIPASAHPPLEQAAVLLSASKNKTLARAFLSYLRRPEVVRLLERHGFAAQSTP